MSVVGRAGEELARSINRRTAVKRTAAAIFGAIAAFSVEGFRRNSALAGTCAYVTTGDCSCNPPYGEFCSRMDSSYCSGSACSGGCQYDESWRYVGACWCSATCGYTGDDGAPLNGYYNCCDCNCYGAQCSCREFIPVQGGGVMPGGGGGNGGGGGGQQGPTEMPGFPSGFPFDD